MTVQGGASKKTPLFEQCKFAVICSSTLVEVDARKIVEQLQLHGGDAASHSYSEDTFALDGVTHIIADTFDFPQYNAATDRLIPVVKPTWIEHSLATGRLAHPRRYSPDPRLFLSDVVATCIDLPQGDEDAIAGGIVAMGGNYSSKLTSQVTHIVALTIDNEMVEQAQRKRFAVKVVLPHWFDDCLKLGKKIDEQPYLLPDPEVLRTVDKAPDGGINKHVVGASHPDPQAAHPEGPKPPHRAPLKVFKNKKIMLDADLGISIYLLGILETFVRISDGTVVDDASETDILVCKYRDGSNYKIASRAGKDVGNLAWLYHLIMQDNWTSPYRRLLHYPVAREGLPGFPGLKIGLSNYSGEARTYLENLIKATGAECTKTLRQENTHLITAHTQSEKVAAARDWNIHVINHLWLEESYSKWQMQTVGNSRYTHFPKTTNLGEVAGQTQLDRAVLERLFFRADVEMKDVAKVPGPSKAQKVTQQSRALDPALTKVNTRRSRRPSEENPSSESDRYQTPAPSRFLPHGKENLTPGTTGSRKSKDAAAARLHNMTTDIALYEKEKKRVGGVVYGGRRKADQDRVNTSRKRSIDDADGSDEGEENDNKKQRKGPASIEMHLLISGYRRWIGKAKEEDADTKKLRDLGIVVVTEIHKATHLAVPHIVRTAKFVGALAYAPMIISTDFIDECLESDEFLSPDDFKLKDKENEKKLGVSLELSRERAKANRHLLLQGRSIFCVEKILGGFETYQMIVEANGGSCMTYRGRPGSIPSRRAGSETSNDDDPQNEVYLLSSDSKEDSRLWSRFAKMAEGSRKTPRIVRSDWLLDTAMCQKIQPTAPYELSQ